MSTNKANISQIQKYLNGELDAKAMHALERQAQNDPFLMDAIEGYQNTGTDQQSNFEDVKQRFSQRVKQDTKRPLILWRVLPIAATLLIALSIGFFWLKPISKPEPLATSRPPQLEKVLTPYKNNAPQITNAKSALADKSIHGIIIDATGHTLAGVKIHIKGTKLSTKTDTGGHFSIAANTSKKAVLNIAANGYDAKQVKLDGKKDLKVILSESTNELASVSVTAYVEDDKPANKAHPLDGWKAFRNYLRQNATMDDGTTGLVKLAFTVGTNGMIDGIRVIKGDNEVMNQKAIDLVLNGPAWKGMSETKQMRLKIVFRKGKDS
ncbi:MAG: carboxypeptidase-like regulatory domain-containing protein [Mucilaginibacter sp.]|uniref:carboxypeptidase-like regulatory domain-containing protein n=1 Tax=Mucilaginibacter sp. TaxID=1882438 RepID=UPI0032674188